MFWPNLSLLNFLFFRFEINFQTCQSSDDIAFNINPQIVRFLVLSSLRNGEDLASDNGAAFNMFVVLKLEGYEVCILNQYPDNKIIK